MTAGGIVLDNGRGNGGGGRVIHPDNQKFTFEIFKVALLGSIGGFLFGYDTGIVSGAMVFIKDDFKLDDLWQELIISATILGAWLFSMAAGVFTEAIGRKKTILYASVIFTVGAILMGAAVEKWTLLLGRFVVGAAIGFASMVVPMYIAEMAPASSRGTLVTINNLFITGGQAFAAIIAGALSYLPEHIGWRIMLAVAAVPAVFQFFGFLFMPESPRWLIRKNRDKEALDVLQRIRGPLADVTDEFEDMKETCRDSEENQAASSMMVLREVFRDKYLRKALLVGCVMMAVQQLTGINTVMYYAATIIQMSGIYDKSKAVWMAAVTAFINFLFTAIGVCLVEKMGRRKLTLASLVGVIGSLVILAIGFQLGAKHTPAINYFSYNTPADSKCFSFESCGACIASDDCGFCFDDLARGANGTCVAAFRRDPKDHAMAGSCINGTKAAEKVVWAKDWCPSDYSWMTLVGLCLYLLFFAPGMGPMPWTVNSEIYPLWSRSVCLSVSTGVCWFFNLVVSVTFLSLTKAVTTYGAFWIYGGFGVAGLIFFAFHLPETKGANLEDTAQLFGGAAKSESRTTLRSCSVPTDEPCYKL